MLCYDWASLIFGINLPFLLCFTLYLRKIFQVQAPGGLIFGGAYSRNITVCRLNTENENLFEAKRRLKFCLKNASESCN